MRATFEFTIAPTSLIEGKYPELEKSVVDVYLMEESSSIYLGQLKNRSIRPSTLNYAHGHQQHCKKDRVKPEEPKKFLEYKQYKPFQLTLFDLPENEKEFSHTYVAANLSN